MYAALFAAEESDIDTITDVELASEYFGDMNYNIEEYINESYRKIDRLYFCTDILLFAGHGEYDKVKITPKKALRTDENCTGVYMGDDNITDGVNYLIGITDRDMSDCRFAMFAACQTANPNYATNIAKSAVSNGADSSIGWRVDVNSTGLHEWEKEFFSRIEAGESLAEAKENTDRILKGSQIGKKYPDIFTSTIYGNDNIILSKDRSKSSNDVTPVDFVIVNEPLNIDCKNGDIDELTQYLDENLEGFDADLFEIELINNVVDGENYYEIIYEMKINGFVAPCSVVVFVKDGNIKYSPTFDKADVEKFAAIPATIDESNFTDSIEAAKEKALENVPSYATVDSQEARLLLDENLSPYVVIKTVCLDESDCRFVLDYECYLWY